jgi:hypothetical protein
MPEYGARFCAERGEMPTASAAAQANTDIRSFIISCSGSTVAEVHPREIRPNASLEHEANAHSDSFATRAQT